MDACLKKYITDDVALYNGDTCELIKDFGDESIHFIIFSPPFSSLYVYSNSDRDLGNSKDDKQFFKHFHFITTELYRILKSGRIMAVHCMNLPTSKEKDGYIGIKDFRGELIREFQSVGFIYHAEVCIWKNPVTAMQRTKALGLLHKQLKKDSCMSRMGIPDYVIFMRKPGENPERVTHTNETFPVSQWQEYASPIWEYEHSPVWWDINQSDTLNVKMARDSRDERHLCFAEGTLVLSKRGYVPIETLIINEDEVLTESGNWHKVVAKAKTGVNVKTVQVKANGVPQLICTPDHNIKAKESKSNGARTRKEATKRQEEKWVKAEDCENHYLKSVMPPEVKSDISPEEWWIIGRYLADGHVDCRGKQYFISVGSSKWKYFQEHASSYLGGIHDKTEECNCIQVGLSGLSKESRDILKKIGRGAKNKVVPYECISLNKELSKAFLDGYESGDGCVCNNKRLYSSASRSLLLSMAIVMQKVYGIIPAVYSGRKEHYSEIRGKKIHGGQEWCCALSPHYSFSFEDENKVTWKKVKSVKDAETHDVWSIEVEEDHTYMCEGAVVKNCPLQLPVIERCIEMYTNPGDVVFSPFGGVMSEPYVAAKMGRKGIAIELKESYFNAGVENIKMLENEKKQMSIFDFMEQQ